MFCDLLKYYFQERLLFIITFISIFMWYATADKVIMAEIRINMSNINRQVRQLNDAANELKREMQNIQSAKSQLSSYWQGNSATVFAKKLDEQYQELSNLHKKITSVAATIKNTAERIKRQEEAILKATQKL